MRIIHVVPALTRGGGERVAVDLANHAAAEGHDVALLAAFRVDESLLRRELSPKVEVAYVSSSAGKLRRYASLLPWLARNWRWLAEADVVHCHMTAAAVIGTALFELKRLTGRDTPTVVETYHAVGMPIPRWHRWLHARLAGRRDALVLMARDPFWTRLVERRPALVSDVIPNGICFDGGARGAGERLASRRELGIPDSCKWVVGTIGRLVPERRPWLYPPVFAGIARLLGPDVHFVIGGSGPELDRVRAAISAERLGGRVQLPGLVRQPSRAFAAMDLYLTLNVGAVTGMSGLEAAAAGLPVMAMQLLDGHRPGESDWIWSSADPALVAERAARLLRSPAERAATAARQQAWVRQRHGFDTMARRYQKLYEAAIAGAPGRHLRQAGECRS